MSIRWEIVLYRIEISKRNMNITEVLIGHLPHTVIGGCLSIVLYPEIRCDVEGQNVPKPELWRGRASDEGGGGAVPAYGSFGKKTLKERS